jgi:hypothetical protein
LSLPLAASHVRETASGGKVLCQIHGHRFPFGVVPLYANLSDGERQGQQKAAGAGTIVAADFTYDPKNYLVDEPRLALEYVDFGPVCKMLKDE